MGAAAASIRGGGYNVGLAANEDIAGVRTEAKELRDLLAGTLLKDEE